MKSVSYDYIVIGGGAGGCVVAARLSEDPNKKVLLLEQGPHANTLASRINGAYFRLMHTRRTQTYHTTPSPHVQNRSIPIMQARMLGGGHSLNGMLYMRGQREDYDGWAQRGCTGWSFDEVLPWFIKSEHNHRLGAPLHGTHGPLLVSDNHYRHVLSEAFVIAAQETSDDHGRHFAYNDDFNGERQEGVGFFQITARKGERASSARTYLHAATSRPNLTIRNNTTVARILLKDKRAYGVAIMGNDGREQPILARKEVIVCAGALISPKLLMLSGIGPAEHLQAHGITPVIDLPGVGENYQDHIVAPVDGALKEPISLLGQDRGLKALRHVLEWFAFRSGLLSSNLCEAGGFFDLDGDGRPEIQIHTIAMASTSWGKLKDEPAHGFSVAPCLLVSHSRGNIRLTSNAPEAAPEINANYLSDERDVQRLVQGVRLGRKILQAPALARFMKGELMPGPSVSNEQRALEDYVRGHVQNAFHPAGTCAMGIGPDAVVDPALKVHGIDGLRVADASIMPVLVRGNTTAPTIMIAERAAAFIHQQATGTSPKPVQSNQRVFS